MAHKTKRQIRDRIEFYSRNLRNAGLATDEEIASVAKPYKGRSSKDDLWMWFADLKALARLRKGNERSEVTLGGGIELSRAYDVAIAALEDTPETVYLASIDKHVDVTPASWARILRIEDIAWWLLRLQAMQVLMNDPEIENKPDNLADVQERIRKELDWQRAFLYAQVVAPTPAPVKEPVDWGNDITPIEEMALMEAYHRVNVDTLSQMPMPKSRDGKRDLPNHWVFLFQSFAWRERCPPTAIIRDRSLVSIVAEATIQNIQEDAARRSVKTSRRKGKPIVMDEDSMAEGFGIDV